MRFNTVPCGMPQIAMTYYSNDYPGRIPVPYSRLKLGELNCKKMLQMVRTNNILVRTEMHAAPLDISNDAH